MLSPAKTELRRHMRAELARMNPAAAAAASESIRTSIPSLPRWQVTQVIAAYFALPGEPDLQPFRWVPQRRLLLPRMDHDRLVFHQVSSPDQLQPGSFGVLEPNPKTCPEADTTTADLIFVPGLAFTCSGYRLGRGRGYYDRLLATLPPQVLRVGVCFPRQIVTHLPTDPHDQSVDLVLSPPN